MRTVIGVLFIAVVGYFLGAFASASLDISVWPDGVREFTSCAMAFLMILAVIFTVLDSK